MSAASLQFDVTVVGAGFAGLAAACRAAQHGLRVAVLERGDRPEYPCNSRVCTGVYHVTWLPETCDEEALYERIMARSDGTARPDLARLVAESAARVKQWLRNQGAEFEPHYSDPAGPEMMSPRRELCAGFDWRDRGPDRVIRRLCENLSTGDGKLHLATSAESLILENDRCVGVRARHEGRPVEYRSRAIVLADGGFQANPDLVSRHIAPSGKLQQRNTGTGLGDGLRMAAEAGAALVGLNRFYGHLLSRDAFDNDRLWPYPQLDVLAATGILVDASGCRFADEGLGGVHMSNEIAGLADPMSASIVFDAAGWEYALREDTVPPNPALVDAGGTIFQGETIERLAASSRIDASGLRSTVDRYNQACSTDDFTELDPPRNTQGYPARPIRTPPFYAVPVCAGITVTTGGVAVDAKARVLRDDGVPIPGLLAAGSTAGGMEGGPRSSYIGGISKAFILGYRAAETIAAG